MSQITSAQAMLAEQLGKLQSAASAGGDGSASLELSNQLASLKSLSQNVAMASGPALLQLRAEVTASVAASSMAAQQAQSAIATASGNAAAQAAYAKATAELDARMSILKEADKKRDDEAHETAARFGIDLKDYDKERAELERERQAAIARGDKIGEDEANVLILQNTKDAQVAAGAKITDPAQKKQQDQKVAEDQKANDAAEGVLADRLDLEGKARAANQGLSGKEADAAVAQFKAEQLAETSARSSELVGSSSEQSTGAAFTAARKAVLADIVPSPQNAAIHEALTPEARAATQQAIAAISNSAGSFMANLSIDGTSQIALSTAPDAHTTVEAPITKVAVTASQTQTRS